MGFQQSANNECVYFCGSTIFFCYADDSVLIDPVKSEIDKVIQELHDLNYQLTDEGNIEHDYLGVKIELLNDGKIKMMQPVVVSHFPATRKTDSPY
jgi:hypothetical protein